MVRGDRQVWGEGGSYNPNEAWASDGAKPGMAWIRVGAHLTCDSQLMTAMGNAGTAVIKSVWSYGISFRTALICTGNPGLHRGHNLSTA